MFLFLSIYYWKYKLLNDGDLFGHQILSRKTIEFMPAFYSFIHGFYIRILFRSTLS